MENFSPRTEDFLVYFCAAIRSVPWGPLRAVICICNIPPGNCALGLCLARSMEKISVCLQLTAPCRGYLAEERTDFVLPAAFSYLVCQDGVGGDDSEKKQLIDFWGCCSTGYNIFHTRELGICESGSVRVI